jgi:S1-C subfamily serine protease
MSLPVRKESFLVNGYYAFLEKMIPATVNIHTVVRPSHPSASILGTERTGSGTLIDTAGHILTVGYVVLGAERLLVTSQRGEQASARIAHIDFESGLAILQADLDGTFSVPLGDSGTLRPGQMGLILAATGTTERRVTEGFVTAVTVFDAYWEYMIERALMTTAVNPGFGGGAFVTLEGGMVGVVSLNLGGLKDSTMVIPLEYFVRIREQMLAHGRVRNHIPRAWIGISLMPSSRGLLVFGVTANGPADHAGVKPGDIILSINDHEVLDRPDMYRHLWQHQAGEEIILMLLREGRRHVVPVHSQDRAVFFQ